MLLTVLAANPLRLNLNVLDFAILIVYFDLVIAIGILARRAIATSEDFLLRHLAGLRPPRPLRPLLSTGWPDRDRHRRADRHPDRLHCGGLQQHYELYPVAVLVLQRPAVRDVHHCHVLEARLAMAGVLGLAAGVFHYVAFNLPYFYPGGHIDAMHATINAQMQNFYGAIAAFLVDAVVTVIVTYMGKPKPLQELGGLGSPGP